MLIQILIFIFLAVPAFAQSQSAGSELNKIFSSVPKTTLVSFSVYDQSTNSFVFNVNQNTPLKPASNMKIITAGAALLYLKPEYRINTFIYYNSSKIIGGVLDGDIYLKGGGNPALNADGLMLLAEKIRALGIIKITGKIIYDNTLFPVILPGKDFLKDLSPIILPAISPISINNNIISVYSKDGRLTTNVNSTFIKIVKSNSGSPKIKETENGVTVYLNSSAINKGTRAVHFFIKNPALLASLILKEKCSDLGIEIKGTPQAGKSPSGLQEISAGTELINILKETNSNSNNFYAETLYQSLLAIFPSNKSTDKILSYFNSSGIELRGSVMKDGSGISSGNRLSALSLVSVLKKLSESGKISSDFKQTLSVAGISGTLKEPYINSVLKGSFSGKSGFMAGVSSISGYLKTKSGKNIIISLIFNFSEKDIDYYRGIERKILEEIYLKN